EVDTREDPERHVDLRRHEERGGQEGHARDLLVSDAPGAYNGQNRRTDEAAHAPRLGQNVIRYMYGPQVQRTHRPFVSFTGVNRMAPSTMTQSVVRCFTGYFLPSCSRIPPARCAVRHHQPGSVSVVVTMPFGSVLALLVMCSSGGSFAGDAGLYRSIS